MPALPCSTGAAASPAAPRTPFIRPGAVRRLSGARAAKPHGAFVGRWALQLVVQAALDAKRLHDIGFSAVDRHHKLARWWRGDPPRSRLKFW